MKFLLAMVDFHGYIVINMIQRKDLLLCIQTALRRSRVVALLGPRQCGKTTLARQFVDVASLNYFDLESPTSLARLEAPMTEMEDLRGVVVIDEIQRRPELFPVLRVLADRKPLPARFLILGSASPDLIQQSSETLAGRIETIAMSGFHIDEVGIAAQPRHWLRGGFPLSFLARSERDSIAWRKQYIQTFLERDLPQLGTRLPATTMLRFWSMLAHYHGQLWNAAEFARSLGMGETSVRRYVDVLADVFMVRQLQPWHANIKKRQVKAPRVYVRDTGILHQLLGIETTQSLLHHPKVGASWEGYILEEILHAVQPDEAFFWRTQNGAEIDLVFSRKGKLYGIEIKRMDAPRMTPSLRAAVNELKLTRIAVIYPGKVRYKLAPKITAVPATEIIRGFGALFG
jgi:uncharacterized protein